MATNATQRFNMAQKLMRDGTAVAIPNPRGSAVDAILVKEFDLHAPANATDIVIWKEYTGNACNTAYSLGI
jgi:hypothetical protein